MATSEACRTAGGGKHLDMSAPGRFADLKLLREQTGDSIMLFEESLPPDQSTFHLHRDSDEVAWVLDGEMTFKIGDEVIVGGPGTCAFLCATWRTPGRTAARASPACCSSTPRRWPAVTSRKCWSCQPDEREDQARLCKTYSWEIVGPNPL